MKRNSCKFCATQPLITPQGSNIDQCHRKAYPKSVRCVMRRNPPVSTLETLMLENAIKKRWYQDNQHIILQLATALKCSPVEVTNYLFRLSFSNFGKALNMRKAARKSCRIPLVGQNCDAYFSVFDHHGNVREPLQAKGLEKLLEILRVILTETDENDSGVTSSIGMYKAMGLKPPKAGKGKSDCFGACVSTKQLRCKAQKFYNIDGRYAGVNAELLIGYPADTIGQRFGRGGCKDVANVKVSGDTQTYVPNCYASPYEKGRFGKLDSKGLYNDEERATRWDILFGNLDGGLFGPKGFEKGKRGMNDGNSRHHGRGGKEGKYGRRGGHGRDDQGGHGPGQGYDQWNSKGGSGANSGHGRDGQGEHGAGQGYDSLNSEEGYGANGKRESNGRIGDGKLRRGGAYDGNDGANEQKRLSPSGEELAKVLQDVNHSNRIADNVGDIIDAMTNVDTQKPSKRQKWENDMINDISGHYAGTVSDRDGQRVPRRLMDSNPREDRRGVHDISRSKSNSKQPAFKAIGKNYYGAQTPVLVHEPFDPSKPWTWIRRHPRQTRIADKDIIANSRIRRYRRDSVEENYQSAKRRISLSSMISARSTMSAKSQAMFGGNMYKPRSMDGMSKRQQQQEQPTTKQRKKRK